MINNGKYAERCVFPIKTNPHSIRCLRCFVWTNISIQVHLLSSLSLHWTASGWSLLMSSTEGDDQLVRECELWKENFASVINWPSRTRSETTVYCSAAFTHWRRKFASKRKWTQRKRFCTIESKEIRMSTNIAAVSIGIQCCCLRKVEAALRIIAGSIGCN